MFGRRLPHRLGSATCVPLSRLLRTSECNVSFFYLEEGIEARLPHNDVWLWVSAENECAIIAHDIDQVLEVVLVLDLQRFGPIFVLRTRIRYFIHFHLSEFLLGGLGVSESHEGQIKDTEPHLEIGRLEEKLCVLSAEFLQIPTYFTWSTLFTHQLINDNPIDLHILARPLCRKWWIVASFWVSRPWGRMGWERPNLRVTLDCLLW